jgi:hypothetical protein
VTLRLSLILIVSLQMAACSEDTPKGKGEDSGDSGAGEGGDGGGDGGAGEVVWEDLSLESNLTLTGCFASGAGLYASAEDGGVYLRSQGTWSRAELTGDEALNGIWGRVDGETVQVMAVGDGGTVATFDGAAWNETRDLGTANMESVSGIYETDLMAVGWGGAFERIDGAWTFQAIDGNPQFNHVWYDGTTAVAVGEEGVIATYRAGVWTTYTHSSRAKLYGVTGTSNGEFWVVGEGGLVLRSSGADWQVVDVGTSASIWAVQAVNGTQVYLGGSNGEAFRTDGVTTEVLNTGTDKNIYAICASSAGVVWATGSLGLTLRLL